MTHRSINKKKIQKMRYQPLAVIAVSLFMTACSNSNMGNQSTAVYNQSDDYTPMEAVEVGAVDNSFLSLAREMAEQGDHNAAIPLYRRAHRYDGSNIEPLIGLGESLSAIGQYNDANDAFQKAMSKNSQDTRALKGLGSSYLALNRPTRALPFLQQAVRVNPRDVDAMSTLAIALDMQGHRAASLEVYRDGLAVDPDNLKLLNNYGLSLALQSRYNQSIEVLKQAAQHKDAGATHSKNSHRLCKSINPRSPILSQ